MLGKLTWVQKMGGGWGELDGTFLYDCSAQSHDLLYLPTSYKFKDLCPGAFLVNLVCIVCMENIIKCCSAEVRITSLVYYIYCKSM